VLSAQTTGWPAESVDGRQTVHRTSTSVCVCVCVTSLLLMHTLGKHDQHCCHLLNSSSGSTIRSITQHNTVHTNADKWHTIKCVYSSSRKPITELRSTWDTQWYWPPDTFSAQVEERRWKKVKVHIALYELENHHRATERHLPYGITQCYLPPDTGERAPP